MGGEANVEIQLARSTINDLEASNGELTELLQGLEADLATARQALEVARLEQDREEFEQMEVEYLDHLGALEAVMGFP